MAFLKASVFMASLFAIPAFIIFIALCVCIDMVRCQQERDERGDVP